MSHELLAWQLSIRLRRAGSCQQLFLKRMTQATDSNCCPSLSGAALTIHKRFYSRHPKIQLSNEAGSQSPVYRSSAGGGWRLTGTCKALTNAKKAGLKFFGKPSLRAIPTTSWHFEGSACIPDTLALPSTTADSSMPKLLPCKRTSL